jgi:hypothetical protein
MNLYGPILPIETIPSEPIESKPLDPFLDLKDQVIDNEDGTQTIIRIEKRRKSKIGYITFVERVRMKYSKYEDSTFIEELIDLKDGPRKLFKEILRNTQSSTNICLFVTTDFTKSQYNYHVKNLKELTKIQFVKRIAFDFDGIACVPNTYMVNPYKIFSGSAELLNQAKVHWDRA